MNSFKILGWKKSFLAIMVGVLLFILPKIYSMVTFYFPESQRGIYMAVDEETLLIDSREAGYI
ncbi:hypothetical protein Hs30E_10840 [Lactococcus hodotermopsidis]|uniref:Uncharacterized protein n=1 Tax=Pseudolactococcus hodotermopsidis TaxID=2709157 RepID=A0A6A0BCV0_9LACT|nr:hypothetical protein [Lactococcus hodotermopsidis]GFH42533.1 hypothetical protein Hs30E_10840 [Lactococcus hodotermopsidis]